MDQSVFFPLQAPFCADPPAAFTLINREKPPPNDDGDDDGADAPAAGLPRLPPEISGLTALTKLQLDEHALLTELPIELFALMRRASSRSVCYAAQQNEP